MLKMSILLTLVLIVVNSLTFANSCEEEVLGQYKKTDWTGGSLGDGVRGELVSQIEKKDDLFEKISPEIEYSFNPLVNLKLKFSRSTKDHLDKPFKDTITKNDLYSIKVKNNLHIEFEAKTSGPFLFSEGTAGIDLALTSNYLPQDKDEDSCVFLNKIIDKSTGEGRDFIDGVCIGRSKSLLTRYYEVVVKFFSQKLNKLYSYFIDTEKGKVFADDPLAPLKLHSRLGVPMDSRIFLEENNEIKVGDIIEHTTFYAIKPLGIKYDIFSFLRPSYAKYARFFRTLAFKKISGNMVEVEIEDTSLFGDSTEIYKISPKLFSLIKLNLGKWNIENFNEERMLQKFNIDLNKDSGKVFFKKILFSAYSSTLDLHKDTILINSIGYEDSVKTFSPVYTQGFGDENSIVLKIPDVITYENRSFTNLQNLTLGDNVFTRGEKLHRKRLKNKIEFNFGPFNISKKDMSHSCNMSIESSDQEALTDDTSLNINCNYTNEYSDNKNVQEITEYLLMIQDGKMDQYDLTQLQKINFEKPSEISVKSNLSFSKKEIDKILNHSEDEIYHEISKLLFGEDAKNIFAKKYHRVWSQVRRDQSTTVVKNAKVYRDCSLMLYQYEINETVDGMYKEFNGLVGNQRGLDSYRGSKCVNYFSMAKSLVNALQEIKLDYTATGKIELALETMSSMNKVGLIQALMLRLAGGVDQNGVHFTYIVTSPELAGIIVQTNGRRYTTLSPELDRSIISELKPVFFPRLSKIKYIGNQCHDNQLLVEFELNYKVENVNDLYVSIDIANSARLKDHKISNLKINLKDIKKVKNKYQVLLDLPQNVRLNESHSIYLTLKNSDGHSLSKETKTYIRGL